MGLEEVVDEQYLRYRVRCNEYIGDALKKLGVPIVNPVGGHAVFIDARGASAAHPAAPVSRAGAVGRALRGRRRARL